MTYSNEHNAQRNVLTSTKKQVSSKILVLNGEGFPGTDCPVLSLLCCIYSHAPEQKARTTYDNLMRLIKDADVYEPLKFLRAREVIHFQRFGEALRLVQDRLDSRNFYQFNPEFDRCAK